MQFVSRVVPDKIAMEVSKIFDLPFDGTATATIKDIGSIPADFGIGVIHGSSGSGKSTILHTIGSTPRPQWNADMAICSHFPTAQEAIERLTAVGLNDIPSWVKPYHALSNGQQFRADMAMMIGDGATIDEFTSVVNRQVAKSASVAMARYVRKKGIKRVVLATCHDDILEWLEPDWTYNTDTCEMRVGRYLRRPTIRLEVYRGRVQDWKMFARHHYLSGEIHNSAQCYIGTINDHVVAFSSVLPMPTGFLCNAYREHRTVLLPDYQGLGIGVRFSDAVASIQVSMGRRYYSKTTHPRMGQYRSESPYWRPTSENMRSRRSGKADDFAHMNEKARIGILAYSHEYIGKGEV